MVTTDHECRILEWGSAARDLLGFEADRVLGHFLFEVIGATDPFGNVICPCGCGLQEMARQGRPVHLFEIEASTAGGARARIIVSVSFSFTGRRGSSRRFVFHLRPDLRRREDRRRLADRRRNEAAFAAALPQSTVLDSWDLSPREREVLHHLVGGATTRELAARLKVSLTTAHNHASNLLHKMGVHSRIEAVALARRHGLG
jgi:DNA-binding CsgD family transcriptional regulator